MIKKAFFPVLLIGILALFGCGGSMQKKATQYSSAGKYQDGIDHFRKSFGKSTAKAMDHLYIHREILRFYHKTGKLQKGLEYYSRFKDKALQLYIKGVYYSILGMYGRALDKFKKAADLKPGKFIIHYDLALAYRKLERYGPARRSLARCLKLNDGFGPAYYEMGMLYGYARHQYAIGQAFLKEAVGKYENFGSDSKLGVMISLGRMYVKLNRIGDAVSEFETVAEKDFRMLSMSIDLGSLYLKQGDRVKAVSFWKKALDLFGHNTIRGRYYFSRLNMHKMKRGGTDLSGVAYYYVVTGQDGKEKTVFGDDEPFFFNNSPVKGLAYSKLFRSGLADGKKGWDVWIVEYGGSRSKAQPVHRWMQRRGVVSTKKFRDGRILLVSVQKKKSKRPVIKVGEYSVKKKVPIYWFRTDARLGVLNPKTGRIKVLKFNCSQFHRATFADVDGNGSQDIIASGFDKKGRLKVSIFISKGQGWQKFTTLTSVLDNRNNGLVFVDLDGKPGLEMVRYSDLISWADVYRRTDRGFVKDNTVYSGFATDFFNAYRFFIPGYTSKQQAAGALRPEMRRLYLAYERFLPKAAAILRKTATP